MTTKQWEYFLKVYQEGSLARTAGIEMYENFSRDPFLQTDCAFSYYDMNLHGLWLPKSVLEKIIYKNFAAYCGGNAQTCKS